MQKTTSIPNISILLTDLHKKLQSNPYDPIIYNQLANLYYKINQLDRAIYYYKRALYLSPNNTEIYFNLANCYVKQGFIDEAISYYYFCLKLNANFLAAMQNLGMLLIETKNFKEALPYLIRVYNEDLEIQKNFIFLEQLANCYLQSGDSKNAITILKQAINIDPMQETAQHNLAILYLRNKEYNLAIKHLKDAIQLNPNNYTASHMLSALMISNPAQAPIKYIVDLFDQYADYYEEHVVNNLHYNLPATFRNLYAKHANGISAKNTLDFGCGTGLCSIYFRDASINLIGVDISRNMLLQAKKYSYDLLIEANLQHNATFIDNYFDLIIASDVLPYFGDLNNIFKQFKCLLKNTNSNDTYKYNSNNFNMLLFNIEIYEINLPKKLNQYTLNESNMEHESNMINEKNMSNESIIEENNENFYLQKSGRYAHTLNYIESLAKKFNFSIIENIQQTIRLQDDQSLPGLLFILKHL